MKTSQFCELMRSLTDNDLVILQDMNFGVKLEVDREKRPGYDPDTIYLRADADCQVYNRLLMALKNFRLAELAEVNRTLANDGLRFLLVRYIVQCIDPAK